MNVEQQKKLRYYKNKNHSSGRLEINGEAQILLEKKIVL